MCIKALISLILKSPMSKKVAAESVDGYAVAEIPVLLAGVFTAG